MLLIAIDGPAGAGKSTIGRRLAEALGLRYLDTGAMYRSIAFAAMRDGLDVADGEAIAELARRTTVVVDGKVTVDGEDATDAIRTVEVTKTVTAVASNPKVREVMVEQQREWARVNGGGVMEGRDIGTVVFPDATLKVYLTASLEERQRRRSVEADEAVAGDIARRDAADASREASPMYNAPDAVVIDTTDRSIEDVVRDLLERVPSR